VASAPVVYLVHGDDEFAIAQFIGALRAKMGEASLADMNTTEFDGATLSVEELRAAACATPFLTDRRLVIVWNPLRGLREKAVQERFLALLDELPPSTALLLAQETVLAKGNWLLKWAQEAGERAFIREFKVPRGGAMVNWIREQAAQRDGAISPPAAARLAELADEDPRMASSELDKLLAYVNYSRAVEVDDVENLAAFASEGGDYFALTDAIGARDGRKAMGLLRQLLREQDPLQLFFGLVGHFRYLLLAREVVGNGGGEREVAEQMSRVAKQRFHPYRAKKLTEQVRGFSLPALEGIYRRLLDYDEQIKTGQMDAELALDTLIAGLSVQK